MFNKCQQSLVYLSVIFWAFSYPQQTQAQMHVRNSAGTRIMTVTQAGRVGIGLTNPGARLSVNGNAAVGAAYASIAAPTNGFLSQGRVGIGVTNPGASLHVEGRGQIDYLFPPNPVTPTVFARDYSVSSTSDVNYVALSGQAPYMVFNSGVASEGYRMGVHGLIVNQAASTWLAGGYLGAQWDDRDDLVAMGAHVNDVVFPASITKSVAGDFWNGKNPTSSQPNHWVIRAFGDKSYFSGKVGVGTTVVDSRIRISGSALGAVPWAVNPSGALYTTIYADHATFSPPGDGTPDIHVAIEGISKIRAEAVESDRYRAGSHGVLMNGAGDNWITSGGLGFERTGTNINYIAGVIGTINNTASGVGSGASLIACAGRFENANATGVADNFVIYAKGNKSYFDGKVGIGAGATSIAANANLRIDGLTTPPSSAYYLLTDTYGNIYRSAGLYNSSLRYKENIQDFRTDFDKILALQPKTYNYRGLAQKEIGYIAEELEKAGLEDLVLYDDQGRPDAIEYDKISLYLLEIIKELKAELRAHIAKTK